MAWQLEVPAGIGEQHGGWRGPFGLPRGCCCGLVAPLGVLLAFVLLVLLQEFERGVSMSAVFDGSFEGAWEQREPGAHGAPASLGVEVTMVQPPDRWEHRPSHSELGPGLPVEGRWTWGGRTRPFSIRTWDFERGFGPGFTLVDPAAPDRSPWLRLQLLTGGTFLEPDELHVWACPVTCEAMTCPPAVYRRP